MKINLKCENGVIFTLTTNQSKTLDEVIALSPLQPVDGANECNSNLPDYTFNGEWLWRSDLHLSIE